MEEPLRREPVKADCSTCPGMVNCLGAVTLDTKLILDDTTRNSRGKKKRPARGKKSALIGITGTDTHGNRATLQNIEAATFWNRRDRRLITVRQDWAPAPSQGPVFTSDSVFFPLLAANSGLSNVALQAIGNRVNHCQGPTQEPPFYDEIFGDKIIPAPKCRIFNEPTLEGIIKAAKLQLPDDLEARETEALKNLFEP